MEQVLFGVKEYDHIEQRCRNSSKMVNSVFQAIKTEFKLSTKYQHLYGVYLTSLKDGVVKGIIFVRFTITFRNKLPLEIPVIMFEQNIYHPLLHETNKQLDTNFLEQQIKVEKQPINLYLIVTYIFNVFQDINFLQLQSFNENARNVFRSDLNQFESQEQFNKNVKNNSQIKSQQLMISELMKEDIGFERKKKIFIESFLEN